MASHLLRSGGASQPGARAARQQRLRQSAARAMQPSAPRASQVNSCDMLKIVLSPCDGRGSMLPCDEVRVTPASRRLRQRNLSMQMALMLV